MAYCSVRKSHYNRKARYNITPADYARMLSRQKGACAICRKAIRLTVDHSHETKKVRGLLCDRCNLLLGHALESVSVLRAAIRYLKRTR